MVMSDEFEKKMQRGEAMTSKAATLQEVALLVDGPLTDVGNKHPLLCRIWLTLFPGLGCELLQGTLFPVEAHHREAKRHCLVPGIVK